MARPRVVIIGGGFGGLHAAKALARADADVVVLDRKNHHVFQPLLYQAAAAAQLIGFRNRFSVLTQWAVSYLTYQRAVRLITDAARDDT